MYVRTLVDIISRSTSLWVYTNLLLIFAVDSPASPLVSKYLHCVVLVRH
jgi:hypothetical protein